MIPQIPPPGPPKVDGSAPPNISHEIGYELKSTQFEDGAVILIDETATGTLKVELFSKINVAPSDHILASL